VLSAPIGNRPVIALSVISHAARPNAAGAAPGTHTHAEVERGDPDDQRHR